MPLFVQITDSLQDIRASVVDIFHLLNQKLRGLILSPVLVNTLQPSSVIRSINSARNTLNERFWGSFRHMYLTSVRVKVPLSSIKLVFQHVALEP